jgi:formylglycine-generating enzyme required for sulfatase activity
MKSQMVWVLPVSLLLAGGMIGYGEEPEPVVEKPKPAMEKAVAAQKECSQRLGLPIEITNSIGMKLKLIPAGEFMMGSAKSPQEIIRMFELPEFFAKYLAAEHPQHKIRITKPFYLGMYEVTQAEYEKVMAENPSRFSTGGGGADSVSGKDTSGYPVETVSWEDAVEFCKRLSAKEGKTYRLPSEVEREYACRAGTTTEWYCGDNEDELGRVAWYGKNSGGTPHPVGTKEANAWGLFDVHGNVWEWCADWLDFDYYAKSPPSDPPGPEMGSFRGIRGGGWYGTAVLCRSAYRYGDGPELRFYGLGFRVARSPSGK